VIFGFTSASLYFLPIPRATTTPKITTTAAKLKARTDGVDTAVACDDDTREGEIITVG